MRKSVARMSRPRKSGLQTLLNKLVVVHLKDGDAIAGILHQTEEDTFQSIPELHCSPNYYCLTHFTTGEHATTIFRCSHIDYVMVYSFDDTDDVTPRIVMETSIHYYPQTYPRG